ncbi:uncharacterized protein [Euphorbia lathyris]|uniref:uncharacterized protein isoform X2 n=1 Tax=Euphorbia lathyris TaxID=212925 RepID=UPI00331345D0
MASGSDSSMKKLKQLVCCTSNIPTTEIVFSLRSTDINGMPILRAPVQQFDGCSSRHAAVVCTETIYRIEWAKREKPEAFPNLSIQHALDATPTRITKFNIISYLMEWLRERGVTTEQLYSYCGMIGTDRSIGKDWVRHRIRGCYELTRARVEREKMYDWLRKHLRDVGPFMGVFVKLSGYSTSRDGHYSGKGELEMDSEHKVAIHTVPITGYGIHEGVES